jgi:hypothetical protein
LISKLIGYRSDLNGSTGESDRLVPQASRPYDIPP